MAASGEDFNKRRLLAKTLTKFPFALPWQFKIKISGMPANLSTEDGSGHSVFDLLCKDITTGNIELETETIKAGTITLTYPSGASPTGITMTMRDHEDRRYHKHFKSEIARVVNPDGTFNLPLGPNGYTRKMEQYSYEGDNSKEGVLLESWIVIPIKLGECTQAQDGEGFLEFPVSFIQYNSQR